MAGGSDRSRVQRPDGVGGALHDRAYPGAAWAIVGHSCPVWTPVDWKGLAAASCPIESLLYIHICLFPALRLGKRPPSGGVPTAWAA
jgi:hypothetical protein